jgi:hypothetical protein
MKPITKSLRQTRLAAVIAALALGASASCWANEATDGSGLTRAQVRAELQAAREAGTLRPNGEIGDTPQVLLAQEAFNQQQTETIVAEYRAEQERDIALAEAEIRRQAIEADGAVLETVMYSPEEEPMGVQVDVIRLDTNTLTTRPEELVVVAVEGGDPEVQLQRAEAIRSHLTAMGLEPRQIYIEAAGE